MKVISKQWIFVMFYISAIQKLYNVILPYQVQAVHTYMITYI